MFVESNRLFPLPLVKSDKTTTPLFASGQSVHKESLRKRSLTSVSENVFPEKKYPSAEHYRAQVLFKSNLAPQKASDMTLPLISMSDVMTANGEPMNSKKWDAFVQAVGEGFHKQGFIALTDHGLWPVGKVPSKGPSDALSGFYRRFKPAFEQPEEIKKESEQKLFGYMRGWDQSKTQVKEAWSFGATHNAFPKDVRDLELNSLLYFDDLESVALKLTQALDDYYEAGGAIQNAFVDTEGNPIGTNQITVNYSKGSSEKGINSSIKKINSEPPYLYTRHKPHKDREIITLLPSATYSGLQVFNVKNKAWQNVVVPRGAIIVNSGNMLALMTKGTDKPISSNLHRVVGSEEEMRQTRLSAPLFVSPNYLKPLIDLATGEPVKYRAGDSEQVLDEAGQFMYLRSHPKESTQGEGYRNWLAPFLPLIHRES